MRDCVYSHDAASLRFALVARPTMTGHHGLGTHVGVALSVSCFLVLVEHGPPFNPFDLRFAAEENRLDFLEVALRHTRKWSPMVGGVAAGAGNVRFLMRLFDAGYPMWKAAVDGEPCDGKTGHPDHGVGQYLPPGGDGAYFVPEWALLVSSDLVRSGPVLLYAVQKGAPLTRRMRVMLGNVRRRARALARCFYKAARLSKRPGAAARKWDAMGQVPIEIIQRIATLARISIAAVDLIE